MKYLKIKIRVFANEMGLICLIDCVLGKSIASRWSHADNDFLDSDNRYYFESD